MSRSASWSSSCRRRGAHPASAPPLPRRARSHSPAGPVFAKPTLSTIPPAAMEQYKPLENLPDDPEELKKIIEELHYKVHSRDVMIDIAEEMFGIQIKKKLGPKR